ncbi:O-antigen ligase [Erythrobacter sp. HL-111]|uniref:O-antigen ligase family protein n=1 Tax=Erythrobacter sp. HL-111 TaxID=1798193 RepID=UPI0006DAC5A7|nr:O-antigen ligase family protein [Erythrobacter sp. HL-111]KPP94420.1 MAG: O-antigen ligase family protein [Erythrobacteraceae bacterium HL-111]SDS55850.1 O-antigen ligase [Erythrobacter sp. HL-111]
MPGPSSLSGSSMGRQSPDLAVSGRSGLFALGTVLIVAAALGGGGQRYGLANLAVQLTALAALALHPAAFAAFRTSAPLALRALAGLSLLLPLLQLVPLPPAIWTALPGRDLVVQSLEAAGMAGWMPFSLDPHRTLLALTALVTPLAVLAAGWTLRREQIAMLGWLVVALGILNLLIGAVQVSSPGGRASLFDEVLPEEVLLGTFANRNSTALFLVGALGFAALVPAPWARRAELALRVGLCALLLLAIILTRSRTGLVLALVPLGLAALRALSWSASRGPARGSGRARPRSLALTAGAAAVAAALFAGLLVLAPGRVADTVERFGALDRDARSYIWEDAAYSSSRYWPLGAGMGTFDEVFQIDESLENMTVRRAGRAHNDYLEIAIEAGLPGLVLVAAWLLLVGWLSWQARRSRWRWTGWAGASFLVCIALQSITDYPLRNQTILAAAGLALLALARTAQAPGERA